MHINFGPKNSREGITWNTQEQTLKKVKIKVKFTLEQATKAQRGSRGTALLFL
jgi:hypothetical protein